MLKSKYLIYLHRLTLSFARSSLWGTPSSPRDLEATCGLRARHRPQPAFPSLLSTSSTARPSGRLRVARRLGGYTKWVRSCAPTQPADSASASGRAPRPLASGLRVRARHPQCHRRLHHQQQDPPADSSSRPEARRLHQVGALARPQSAGGLRVRVRQGPAPSRRRTPRPRPAPSTSPSASSSTARPSGQLFESPGGYTQWVRSRAPTQPADSASASGRAPRAPAGGFRIRARHPQRHRRLHHRQQDPPADSLSRPKAWRLYRLCAPTQLADSASASGRAPRPPVGELRVRARHHRCHGRLHQQQQRPSAQLFQVARRLGGYTKWVRSRASTRSKPRRLRSAAVRHRHLLLHQRLLKPSAQLFQVARRLRGYRRGV
ncbi:hypothetical protein ACQJBY_054150 [Aegilops geniculata]